MHPRTAVHRLAVAVEQWPACTVSCFSVPRTGTRHFCILFTFHAIPLHEALSVFCCHGTSPPSGLYSRLTIVRPFPFFSGTMASADFLRQALLRRFGFFFPYFYVRKTSPGKSNNLPPIYLPHLHCKVRAVLDFVLVSRLVRFALPHMRFLFVRPGVCPCWHFAASTSGFLQIPPHDGHPCLRLTVPTAKSVVDFHHQVIAHAGRTERSPLFDATLEKRALFMPPPSCATRREAAYIYKTKEPEKPAAFPRFRALQDW